jgi:hypothetical protein
MSMHGEEGHPWTEERRKNENVKIRENKYGKNLDPMKSKFFRQMMMSSARAFPRRSTVQVTVQYRYNTQPVHTVLYSTTVRSAQ